MRPTLKKTSSEEMLRIKEGKVCYEEIYNGNHCTYLQFSWRQSSLCHRYLDTEGRFRGSARYVAVGFSIGAKGYVGMGTDHSSIRKDFWEYDPDADTWTQTADFAGQRGQQLLVSLSAAKASSEPEMTVVRPLAMAPQT